MRLEQSARHQASVEKEPYNFFKAEPFECCLERWFDLRRSRLTSSHYQSISASNGPAEYHRCVDADARPMMLHGGLQNPPVLR